jgi:hypothetical protein
MKYGKRDNDCHTTDNIAENQFFILSKMKEYTNGSMAKRIKSCEKKENTNKV